MLSMPMLRAELEAVAEPESAPAMAAYMQHHFQFLGVKTPQRRAAVKPTMTQARAATGDELCDFVRECWEQPEREFQYVGADLLRANVKRLESRHLAEVEDLIVTKAWWDTVDALAAWSVGPLVRADPALVAVMDQWIDDDDIWLARTAILHQLHFGPDTDADRLFDYARRRAGDTEFFIRKAIGWALRQYARTDPEAVRALVAAHDFSGLTRREALKHL
ncbi:MAG TPA: DNA alkylation repair protein [Ilumatobacteraceae bacterium]|nr:DNA alkylation repair protein [Ilumatobacteraceae bacterium]